MGLLLVFAGIAVRHRLLRCSTGGEPPVPKQQVTQQITGKRCRHRHRRRRQKKSCRSRKRSSSRSEEAEVQKDVQEVTETAVA